MVRCSGRAPNSPGPTGSQTPVKIAIERRVVMPAYEYIGHLSTIREEVFDRILNVLPARVTLNADLTLHLARLVSPSDT